VALLEVSFKALRWEVLQTRVQNVDLLAEQGYKSVGLLGLYYEAMDSGRHFVMF
jgi:hypothetical protein